MDTESRGCNQHTMLNVRFKNDLWGDTNRDRQKFDVFANFFPKSAAFCNYFGFGHDWGTEWTVGESTMERLYV